MTRPNLWVTAVPFLVHICSKSAKAEKDSQCGNLHEYLAENSFYLLPSQQQQRAQTFWPAMHTTCGAGKEQCFDPTRHLRKPSANYPHACAPHGRAKKAPKRYKLQNNCEDWRGNYVLTPAFKKILHRETRWVAASFHQYRKLIYPFFLT